MRLKKLLASNLVLVGSFLILASTLAYFRFKDNPPQFANVFSQTRPGVLIFENDEFLSVNTPFKVTIIVDSKNQSVNAVGLYLNFNPTKLQLVNIDTSQSFCQYYPEKRFDNNLGTVNLVCGAPHPGVSDKNALLVLEFIPLDQGKTNILVDPRSKILLSNGKGTNILEGSNQQPHELTIRNSL